MGLVDTFGAEDRMQVKFSDFYNLVKGCTQRDQLLNAVKCEVPYRYIREMMTGKNEAAEVQSTETDIQDKQASNVRKG